MATSEQARHYCALPPQPERTLPSDLSPGRARAILAVGKKWVNGTVLHYAFFDDGPWAVPDEQREVVRGAFTEWKDLGVGLEYQEVQDRSESEVRIGYSDDGSWSAVGRDVLQAGVDERTMNFGWDLTTVYGHTTARHEIGHTLGLEHEHQNPFAGIVWNEEAVYASLGGPPNNWTRQTTFFNILRKLSPAEVAGSTWDPTSIMEYAFDPGLIREPAQYADGIDPPGTISAQDRAWALTWYPALATGPQRLEPLKSAALSLQPGQQADFAIEPPASRRYQIATFGTADTLIVLFEVVNGEPKYLAGDDDSGTDTNAQLSAKLLKGRRYILRVRLYWAGDSNSTAVMYW